MQYFTLIGGFVGFLLTFAVSILAGKDLAESVSNATIGCIVGGFLFRGFPSILDWGVTFSRDDDGNAWLEFRRFGITVPIEDCADGD